MALATRAGIEIKAPYKRMIIVDDITCIVAMPVRGIAYPVNTSAKTISAGVVRVVLHAWIDVKHICTTVVIGAHIVSHQGHHIRDITDQVVLNRVNHS